MRQLTLLLTLFCLPLTAQRQHIVLIAGDQEYRSEESIPALAKILAKRGFECTVLYSTNRQTGEIDPSTIDNIPGLDVLREADLMVMFLRWLELPDEQMMQILDYTNAGKPIVALRTSTHPFHYVKHPDSPYAKYDYASKDPAGGYGRMVIGETWVRHWGKHQTGSHARRGCAGDGKSSDPARRQGCIRRIGCLRDHHAFRRQPADPDGPGALGHGAVIRAESGEEADADCVGQDIQRRARFRHDDGARQRFQVRRLPAHDGKCLLLGAGDGKQDIANSRCGSGGRVRSQPGGGQ